MSELIKAALLGCIRYISAMSILLIVLTLICEAPTQGITLASSIIAWLISSQMIHKMEGNIHG